MRRLFYAAVLAVALYGTATGAVAQFGLPWWVAIGGIFALELGGVVFLSNAEVRRRLGEHASLSRLLGAAVAGAAATFNVLTHRNLLLGGFFALMSVLGFLAWWLDVENKRRDRLRARGQLAAATPSYELWGHWLRHPVVTRRARGFAKAYPQLGLYGSLEATLITMRREKRNAALADALRTRIRAAVGKDMADIAVLTFDMDEVASRLRDGADYDGLTALLGSELTAERVLHGSGASVSIPAIRLGSRNGVTVSLDDADQPDSFADGVRSPEGSMVRHDRAAGHAGVSYLSDHQPDEDSVDPAAVKVRILGPPALIDADGSPVRGLRTKSTELLVYLAVHRDGAPQADIVAAIWPDVTPERAAQRLSTCLANLRSIIRQARESSDADGGDGDTRVEPVVNTAGTYRLDPAIVTVDWWQTVDGYARAARNGTDSTNLAQWRHAIGEALDSLAEDSDYPWIDAERERARRDLARLDNRRDG